MTQYFDSMICNACTIITIYDPHYNRKTTSKFKKSYKASMDKLSKHKSYKDCFLDILVRDPERNKFVRDTIEESAISYMPNRGFKIENIIDV